MQKSQEVFARLNWDDLRFFLEVARTRKASGAAKRLSVDYTTVARRIRQLEETLGALLFEKSRTGGFLLTADGQRLLGYAEAAESTLQSAVEDVAGAGKALSGQVRIASTEGFGCFFLTPVMAHFQELHPQIGLDLLPVPHFVSLSRREADLAVNLERPQSGPYVCTRLCDYKLRLYATEAYLQRSEPIRKVADLARHPFITYVEDLAFSAELLYLERVVPEASSGLRSTSVVAQYFAALEGRALAILPCFMAAPDPRLKPVLPEIEVTRRFWLYCREDLRKLRRITLLWDYLRESAELNRALLEGESDELRFLEGF
jgi:DNA-binding transcriptional LysR family regulator